MGSAIDTGNYQGSAFANGGTGQAEGAVAQGKQHAARIAGAAKGKAFEQVDARKGQLVEQISSLASTLENAGQNVNGVGAQLLSQAAGVARKASDLLGNGSTEDLLRQAMVQFRQRPGAAIAGLALVGFFAGRLVKDIKE